LQQLLDQAVDPPDFLINDIRSFQGAVDRSVPRPAPQHFQIYDDGVERILDLMSEVVGKAAEQVITIRSHGNGIRGRLVTSTRLRVCGLGQWHLHD
jgi:hypothetical protein